MRAMSSGVHSATTNTDVEIVTCRALRISIRSPM
jgi:hypothetical protein